jgi:hypothetical protein
MPKDTSAAVALTVRVDADLLKLLDREVSRLEAQTGLRLGRAACVLAVLRRGLAATSAAGPDPVARLAAEPAAKPTAQPAKRKPTSAGEDPAGLDEKALRTRCRAIRGASTELAKTLGLSATSAVRHWWAGKASWDEDRLAKVRRWLNKQEA